MSNSKPKSKDQSSNKFLQRIAGKKAIGPPPTPRPIIGEHPVRTLLRENADEIEKPEAGETIQAEILSASLITTAAPERVKTALQISKNPDLPSTGSNVIGQLNSSAGGIEGAKVESISAAPGVFDLDQKPPVDRPETIKTLKNSQPGGALKLGKGGNERVPDLSRSEAKIISIRKKYRLNRGEFALYREFYLMTHAVGQTKCSFVVSELVNSTGMLERRVRDNLRRLKKNGWLVLLEGYDFENREKAKYRVNTEPGF